jgi:Domain of unknown function (DUF4105)
VKIAARILLGLAVAGMTVWGVGAIYYAPVFAPTVRFGIAALFVLAVILAFLLVANRARALVGFLLAFALMVALYFQIPASNDRDWQPDVALTPYAVVVGDIVTIHNIRNFEYRTETDFTPRWETRTYDLRKLNSSDLIAVYWAGKTIAHIMVSFGFEGKDYLAVSIETRKEKNESYSTLAGFFRQYELYYVVADERDVIAVRTTYRQPQEDVYVYRVRGSLQNLRRVFLEYIKSINELHQKPAFYNTLTTNCTTSILTHARINPESPPMSWKILLSGYVPEYLYELGRIDTTRPFAELEKLSHINERANAAGDDANFSRRIREALPVAQPLP